MALRAIDGFSVEEGPHRGRWVRVEVPDTWHLLLDLGEDGQGVVETSFSIRGTRAPQLELWGRRGTMALDLLDVSAPLKLLQAGPAWQRLEIPRTGRRAGPDHLLGIQHLVDCVREDREPVLSADHALHVVEILEKAAEAAAEGRTLELETSFHRGRIA
jgi:predicted dehydrogenase